MPSERFNALPAGDIPKFARPIDGAGKAVVAREVELATTQLASVTFQCVYALTCTDIPDFRGIVE